MTVTGINITEKVRDYNGNNSFIKNLKPGLSKYGRLTPKQFAAAEKIILNEVRSSEVKVEDLPQSLQDIVNYSGELKFVTVSEKAVKIEAKLTKENGGICRCCGRTLTDDISKMTGIGPVCSGNVGVKHPTSREDLPKYNQMISDKIDEIGTFEFWVPKRGIVEWNGHGAVLLKL